MRANTAAIVVGRLLEVRVDLGYRTVADVDELFDAIDVEVAKLPPSRQLVTAVDWRRCPIMNGPASDRVLERIVTYNERTERSSALASPGSPTSVLQFVRLIREAGLPDRKMFFSPDEQVEWLREVLTPAETSRLREFLAEGERFAGVARRSAAENCDLPSRRSAGGRGR